MRLQLALDAAEHFALLPILASYFDIVEVGTPLLKRFGVAAITTARELSNGRPILADTKTVDGGGLEAQLVFGAGAQWMTRAGWRTGADATASGRGGSGPRL